MPKSNRHSVNPDCESRISKLEYTILDKRTGIVKNVEKHSTDIGELKKNQYGQSVIIRTVILGLTAIIIGVEIYQRHLMYLAAIAKP